MPGAGKTYAIHPALGLARLGDAPADPEDHESYYLAPEAPGQVPNAGGTYKANGRIKKQAQRFRVYEYADGRAVREITLAEPDVASVEWTVRLANRKAALDLRDGSRCAPPFVDADFCAPARTRNADVTGADRAGLAIDPGPTTAREPGARVAIKGAVRFPGGPGSQTVALGALYMEPGTGRLLVFGGDGRSLGLLDGVFTGDAAFGDYANSDGWFDDTSDGWVQAVLRFRDGSSVTLDQPEQRAWVICPPPRYAPGLGSFTTLYDVAVSAVTDPKGAPRPSFTKDIYPILLAASGLRFVSKKATAGHGAGQGADYLMAGRLATLAGDGPRSAELRRSVFARINDPSKPLRDERKMPQPPEDVLSDSKYEVAALTPLQYDRLRRWSEGDFEPDWNGPRSRPALNDIPVEAQPDALDRAALEGSAGTPFYPGIESWRFMRRATVYAATLRFKTEVQPGDLTIGNALPWQADFLDCDQDWWPVQRPNEVWRDGHEYAPWTPAAWATEPRPFGEMVRHWSALGFVVSLDGGLSFGERERSLEAEGPA